MPLSSKSARPVFLILIVRCLPCQKTQYLRFRFPNSGKAESRSELRICSFTWFAPFIFHRSLHKPQHLNCCCLGQYLARRGCAVIITTVTGLPKHRFRLLPRQNLNKASINIPHFQKLLSTTIYFPYSAVTTSLIQSHLAIPSRWFGMYFR